MREEKPGSSMFQKTVKIRNKLGLHARPAAMIAKEAGRHPCEIYLLKDGIKINAKSIMGIMMLAAGRGSTITIIADGEGEEEAIKSLEALVDRKFNEEQLDSRP